jgi:hypothetical protein
VGEVQKVWDFLGQAESALVPFGFSPLRFGVPAQEVSAELPLLDSAGAKMLELEDVVTNRLEVEGRNLAEVVAEHVLLCLRSQDPQVSLELVVQGHAKQILESHPLYPVRLARMSVPVAIFQRRHLGLGSRWKPLLIDHQLLHSLHEGCGAGPGHRNTFPASRHGVGTQPTMGHCSSIRL